MSPKTAFFQASFLLQTIRANILMPLKFFLQIKIQLYLMNPKKTSKTVQNYTLEEVKYINSDGSTAFFNQGEIWLVSHKLTKKRYMMKKLEIQDSQAQQTKTKASLSCREEAIYNNLQRQVNILKSLPGDHYPKRNKIIKTTNNYYLVYDLFPEMLLQTFLDQEKPRNSEKLQLLITIAQQLSIFHQRGVVLLNLNINSIHVICKNKILVRDWGMARNIDDGDIASFELPAKRKEFIAEEVERGKYSYASDVYSLGKLISRIVNRGEFNDCKPYKAKLEELAAKMIHQDSKLRPSIDSIITSLQRISFADTEPTPKQTPFHFIGIKQKQFCISTKKLSQFSIGSTQSGDKSTMTLDLPFFTPKNFTKKDVNTTFADIKSFKSGGLNKNTSKPELLNRTLNTMGYNHTSHTNLARENSSTEIGKETNNLQLAKSICKRRSLAFFILTLAEFVIKSNIVLELAYILTKYARLSITSIIKEVEAKMKHEDMGDIKFLLVILDKELSNITSSQLRLKKKLVYEGVKRELIDDKTISDPLLRRKVLEFGKKMIDYCDEEIINGNHAIDIEHNLLQTYFILKKIELGSYQRFCNTEQSFLSSHAGLKEKLSPREVLQRITNILQNNS